jgi:hypothetical protein
MTLINLTETTLQQVVFAVASTTIGVQNYMIINRDEVNQIRLGYAQPSGAGQTPDLVTPDASITSIVDPLGFMVVSSLFDWYAYCATATVILDVVPTGSNWAASPEQIIAQLEDIPVQTASYIASGSISPLNPGGTPLLHGIDFLYGSPTATVAVPAASTVSASLVTVHKPGYVLTCNAVVANAASTIPFVSVLLEFWDTSQTVILGPPNFWTIPATSSGTWTATGSGPTRGPAAVLSFTNQDPTYSMTVTYSLIETTQHISRDDWRGPLEGPAGVGSVPQYTSASSFLGSGDIRMGSLMATQGSGLAIGAGDNLSILMPMYSGDIGFTINATGTLQLFITPPLQLASVDGIGNAPLVIASGESNYVFGELMPRYAARLSLTNGGAATIDVTVNATILEYAS